MKISAVALVAGTFLSGCAFLSPYDSDAEADIRELMHRTNEVVADGNAGRLSLADSQQFLRQSQARMQVLRIRATQSHMSKEALTAVDALEKEYETLLARNHPLRGRAAAELQRRLFALQDLKPVASVFRRVSSASSSDDSSNDVVTKDADEKKKECQDKNKRDHDEGDCRKHR